jgi:hypothetical protein
MKFTFFDRPMKKLRVMLISALGLPVLIGSVAVILGAAPTAQKQVLFKGAIQAHDSDTFLSPTTVLVTTSGTGIGTLLGQFTFTLENTVDLAAGTETGSAHFIAANGDTLDAAIVGSGEPTDTPDIISITEINTITGGTGRFAGAQGSFTVERLANVVTFFTAGSFHGTITPPGADH